ncbi:restriction endonuclease subunit S [Pseudomonas sp. ok266]|uniref:restriction endonuclease subunit S n=1 Tax=Pseudomonas sp. ok266 TaxID=1761896 RepID=UPI0008B7A925|nr:restriction endonuclease subunit S [Pseudomonas sp. ok266]SEO71552.1 type I restriction enzyme, S subunit [Pseudomonas sp. ok266]
MTALLTDNLPLLAGAPNGIKKLRELILELAVRGKLVPQDPNDEPASELLMRIAEEKARLVAEGKIKKQKALAEIAEEKMPFDLPVGWCWTSLNQIAAMRGGSTPSMSKPGFWNGDIPWVSPKDMHDGDITGSELKVTQLALEKTSLELVPLGSILLVGRSGILKRKLPAQITAVPCTINQDLKAISPFQPQPSNYVQLLLRGTERVILKEDVKQGTTVQSLIYEKLFARPFGLPPLAEQHRIIAKVDELMALCDRLEAQQADGESAHAQLVQTLLDSLTQAGDANGFATNWQRLAEHFHTLFTTEPSIDALKQTLLQLAVMGKLVPQNLSDEPASELLKRIAEEKMRLVAAGKLRNQKQQAEIGDTEKSFELPAGWVWQRFADFALDVSTGPFGSLIHQSDYVDGGVPLVNPSHMIDGLIVADHSVSLSPEMAATLDSYRLNAGDMVMARRGEVGRVALVTETEDGWLCGTGSFVLRFTQEVSRAYVWTLFRCNSVRTYLAGAAVGTTMVNLNHGILLKMPIAVPPLAEQHRIVAKLDQLMSLCGQLENCLKQARQLKVQLASTLVEHAHSDDAQQAPVATEQKAARTLLAAEVTHRLHAQRTFGQRKLQKVVYLAEHAARLTTIQGSYLRNVAGPHDRQLMNQIEGELQNHQWYECIERETVGHAYRPLSQAGQHRQAYTGAWSATERATIEQIIELMRDWDTDRCEMTVTLYAAWNDFILEGRPVTDEAIVDEVTHRWNDTKLRFGKPKWLAVLAEMKKQKILTPTGFGKRTTGGILSLPGFE